MDRLSVRLYETMEKIGVSEVMRAAHRGLLIHEIVFTVDHDIYRGLQGRQGGEYYFFGSQTEGTTTFDMGSDVDFVWCQSDLPVNPDVTEDTDPRSLLMIQDEHTPGGYVKLQCVEYGRPLTIRDVVPSDPCVPDRYGRICLTLQTPPGRTRHGPAFDASSDDIERDAVRALKCFSLPAYAEQWLHRPRSHGWPSRDSLIRMSSLPCFVVYAGHPFSDERDMEWRLSYSLHERELMFSLNPVQHKCYMYMKMVKKNIIQYIIGEESITSYHFKTCLFWSIENTAPEQWRADNLIPCLKVCFKLLHRFLRRRNCPNFFLPGANLFDREVIARFQEQLIYLVNAIRSNMTTTIANIQCSGLGSTFLTGQVPRPVSEGLTFQRVQVAGPCIRGCLYLDKTISQLSHSRGSTNDRLSTLNAQLSHMTQIACITSHTEEQTREAKNFILPALHFRLATCLAAEGLTLNMGPSRERLLSWSDYHLQCSEGRDLAGATLVRASLMYKLRRYDMCELLLEELDSRLTSLVVPLCCCSTSEFLCDWILGEKIEAENMSAKEILASYTVACLTFLPCERELIPEPLSREMERSRGHVHGAEDEDGFDVYEWATVDGVVYFHFLQYLVYSKLNKPVHKQAAVANLSSLIEEDSNLGHKDTALKLLGFVYSNERKHALAFGSSRLSLVSLVITFVIMNLTIFILFYTFFSEYV